jgi:beta-mannosidase
MICSKLCTRLVVAGALFLQLAAAALRIIDLTEQTWTLASPDNDVSVRGKVPSHAHVDLYNAGVIEDPYVKAPSRTTVS